MTATAAAVPAELEERALTWPEEMKGLPSVEAYKLLSDDDRAALYAQVGDRLVAIKGLRKEVDATFDPIISKAHLAHKEACDQKRKVEAPLAEAERVGKARLGTYDWHEDNLRRQREAEAAAAARKADDDARQAEALALEEAGEPEAAAHVIEQPTFAPAPVVQKAVAKTAGVSMRETWSAEVVDKQALVAFVATHPEFLHLVTPDFSALNSLARSLKDHMRIAGVKPRCTRAPAVRG